MFTPPESSHLLETCTETVLSMNVTVSVDSNHSTEIHICCFVEKLECCFYIVVLHKLMPVKSRRETMTPSYMQFMCHSRSESGATVGSNVFQAKYLHCRVVIRSSLHVLQLMRPRRAASHLANTYRIDELFLFQRIPAEPPHS